LDLAIEISLEFGNSDLEPIRKSTDCLTQCLYT